MKRREYAEYKRQVIVMDTVELHDGEPCECLPKSVELRLGDTLKLEHTCRTGRKDILRATLKEIR